MRGKDFSYNTSEEKLINIGKYAILGLQLNGYLPLCVLKNQTLSVRRCSKEWLYSVLLSVTVATCVVDSIYRFNGFFDQSTFIGRTEMVVLTFTGVLSTDSGMILRMWGVYDASNTLLFWKRNCSLLSSFSRYGFWLEDNHALSKIKKSTFNNFLFCQIITFTFLIANLSIGIYEQSFSKLNFWLKNSEKVSLVFTIGQVGIALLSLQHTSHGVWVTFFLKYYSACFNMISCKLEYLYNSASSKNFKFNSAVTTIIEAELSKCYHLYHQVEKQIQDFNYQYRKRLLFEIFLSICNIVIYTFFMISWEMRGFEYKHFIMVIPIITFSKHLYDLGTDSSLLTAEAHLILDQLHRLYELNLSVSLKQSVLHPDIFLNLCSFDFKVES